MKQNTDKDAIIEDFQAFNFMLLFSNIALFSFVLMRNNSYNWPTAIKEFRFPTKAETQIPSFEVIEIIESALISHVDKRRRGSTKASLTRNELYGRMRRGETKGRTEAERKWKQECEISFDLIRGEKRESRRGKGPHDSRLSDACVPRQYGVVAVRGKS